jgi:aminoglycoside 6-adenylyltransferase
MVGVPPPSAAEFRECMEWFYAAALQYAKGLRRDDPWPVKVRDAELKQQLLRMIEWDFGVRHGWAERPPHNGSKIAGWADADVADAVARCWADLSIGASADALFYSMTLFEGVRKRVSSALGFADEVSVRATIEVQRLLAPSVP